MTYSRPASGMVFTKPRLAGPSGIIIQQDRRFGNTFGNGFEIAVQLDITDCTFLSWVFQSEENNAAGRTGDFCLHLRSKRVKDHAHFLTILHFLSRLHEAAEDPARRGKHICHLVFLHDGGQIPAVAVVSQ